MAGPIAVDLENAQQCEAAEMTKFPLAFCRSGGGEATNPVPGIVSARGLTAQGCNYMISSRSAKSELVMSHSC